MNTADEPRPDDAALDAAWRAVRENSAPSPAAREAILAAAARAAQAPPAANEARWRLRAAAAIVVVGLLALIAQQVLRQQRPASPTAATATAPANAAAPTPAPASAAMEVATAAVDAQAGAAAPVAARPIAAPPMTAPPIAARPDAAARASAEAAQMAKAPAPQQTDSWAHETEALLNAILARRGVASGTVTLSCRSDRCELAGAADTVRELIRAPELVGRLRGAAAGPPVAGLAESAPRSGTVRYTLERVPGS